ncbi:MAG: glycosyltransferase [Streptosporangiaceae bacterium]
MTAAPRISVGLPVYNGLPYLEGALASLLAQDTDFELVIADNCSTDGTQDICRDLARTDERVRYLRRDRNLGVVGNHNQIIHDCRGELFSFAASDDEYRADRLSRLAAALDAQPDAVTAISAAEEIDSAGRVLLEWHNSIRTDHPDAIVRMKAKLAEPVFNLQLYGLHRRAALAACRPQAPIKGSDRILIVELALRGRFTVVDEPLLRHRNHDRRDSESVDSHGFRASQGLPPRRVSVPNAEDGVWLLRAVGNVPLSRRDRVRAYAGMSVWLRHNAVPMVRNVARAARTGRRPRG